MCSFWYDLTRGEGEFLRRRFAGHEEGLLGQGGFCRAAFFLGEFFLFPSSFCLSLFFFFSFVTVPGMVSA